jgi:hypothetical protein
MSIAIGVAREPPSEASHALARLVLLDALSRRSCSADSGVLTASQEIDIRPTDEILDAIAIDELCEANGDGARGWTGPQKPGHLAKAPANLLKRGIRQRTNELIAAEAHDQVIGAQAGSERVGDRDQQRIAREVTLGVVDLLQTVDIDERDHKPFARSASALALTLELFHTRPAPSNMGQLIDLGRLAVKRGLNPVARRHRTITRGLLAFRGRPETICRCIGAIVRSPPAITRDPQQLLSRHRTSRSSRTITRPNTLVSPLGYPIARRGYTSALPGRDIPRGRHIQTSTSLPVSQLSRVLTSRADLTTNLLAGSRRRFLIAGRLILIRGQLITIGGRLILIRGRLIPIGRRLITVRYRLIFLGSRLF